IAYQSHANFLKIVCQIEVNYFLKENDVNNSWWNALENSPKMQVGEKELRGRGELLKASCGN
ncbi:unnamed protein product, partial [Citrullus colocynthis]